MPEVRGDTVAALAERTVFAFCSVCRREARLDLPRLVAVFPRLTIGELRERVTCRRCGSRTRELRIAYAAATR